jgi:hypothetical protein
MRFVNKFGYHEGGVDTIFSGTTGEPLRSFSGFRVLHENSDSRSFEVEIEKRLLIDKMELKVCCQQEIVFGRVSVTHRIP